MTEAMRAARAVAAVVLIAVGRAAAQQMTDDAPQTPRVVVSIPDCKLAVLDKDGGVEKMYDVAVGASVSPSPEGTFKIVSRIVNPTYYHAGKVIGPGKANPVGTRWIGLSVKGFGIHGTNAPRSIGKAASHGCIRLRNRDIEDLFGRLRTGDVVEFHGERDKVVAQVFGGTLVAAVTD